MEKEIVIQLNGVSKTYTLYENQSDSIRGKVWNALRPKKRRVLEVFKNINLTVEKGDFIGVLGKNGSGKSTLLNIMCGAIPPDKGGEVFRNGTYIRLALGMGFNADLSAKQNIYLNASVLGLSIKQIDAKLQEILDFSDLHQFVHTPIKYFSTGMRSRLAFAIAVYADADIFIMDEFFGGVGDEQFKKKSNEVFEQRMLTGRTIVHVSHNLGTITKFCNKVVILHEGQLHGPYEAKEGVEQYKKWMGIE
jgi:ABC-2 type transport system ATP-binding protein